jgi:serine O-acetyltransferase
MGPLVADLREMTGTWGQHPAKVLARTAWRVALYPRLRALLYFRMGSWCWHHHLRPVALWFQACSIKAAGAEIHPAADIGPGLAIIHSVGIVVGHEVVAGQNLVLYQGVTLGHTGRGPGQPRIGDNVRIGAGAKVLGAVTIGDNAWIGANAVVLADVGAGVTVGGLWRG